MWRQQTTGTSTHRDDVYQLSYTGQNYLFPVQTINSIKISLSYSNLATIPSEGGPRVWTESRQIDPLCIVKSRGKKAKVLHGKEIAPRAIDVTWSVIWRVFECWWPRLTISGRSTCTSSENREARGRGAKKRGLWDAGDMIDWTWLIEPFGCYNWASKMPK